MQTIRIETVIDAPVGRCFDLARSVDAHIASAKETGEKAVTGTTPDRQRDKTHGLLDLDDTVTWEVKHFGIRQRLTSQITAMDAPHYFQDQMLAGAFKKLSQDHLFETTQTGGTRMVDVLHFQAPGGWLLRPITHLLERLILAPHMKRFLIQRGQALKTMAESNSSIASTPIK